MEGFGNAIEMCAGIGEQALTSRTHPIESLRDATEQSDEKLIEHRAVQRFLVTEVVIQQCLVDFSGSGDGVHARARETFLGEFAKRRLEDGAAAGLGLAAGPSPRCR